MAPTAESNEQPTEGSTRALEQRCAIPAPYDSSVRYGATDQSEYEHSSVPPPMSPAREKRRPPMKGLFSIASSSSSSSSSSSPSAAVAVCVHPIPAPFPPHASTCGSMRPMSAEQRVALAARQLRVGVALAAPLSPPSPHSNCDVSLAGIYEDANPEGTELRTLVQYEFRQAATPVHPCLAAAKAAGSVPLSSIVLSHQIVSTRPTKLAPCT
ncbi:hypothetical protein K438DRAFT_1776709 [Mycena galopus ATCC 62051]|nr:hypothetical protein K438DRAFT_1776709 [Mycena galopus ATCC 62051]